MVRTKADRVPVKAVGSKAPRKLAKTATPVKKTSSSKGKSSGGNAYHPRETPEWQKPITCFLNQNSLTESTNSSEMQEGRNEGTSKETRNESD
ncbi:PCNA-associated factor [Habropoda laboriosa]|uniref:PCNA-associated factor n=1 Tax=Habropoda laboriosa TaxID=597456 RepID=A0A0L7QU15_9HYME|nr:PREDICTED: PCNA-associated factor-like [Habropoda laboriosa]KOC62115.1 PCNA-associated factor [Habropoda laboriosa]